MTETAEVAALRAANEAREAKKREERLERAEGDQPRRVRVPRPRALHQRELAEARFLADQASGKQAEQRAAAAAATARLRVQREKEQAERAEAQRAAAAAAERRELEGLEALVRSILRENPFSEHASEDEETEWRELAHASRQLLPLFEALRKADEPNSEYARYRAGFRFRLQEAQTTIAKLIQYGRIHPLRQRSFGAEGGNQTGPANKAKADARWRNEARRIAKEIVAEGKRKWSRLALVSEIKSRWIGDAKSLPGDKQITRLINEMLKKGEISLDT
jgi:hypothetical protein